MDELFIYFYFSFFPLQESIGGSDGGKVGNPVEKIRTRPRPCPSNTSRVISHH